jgi:hypothetical protein
MQQLITSSVFPPTIGEIIKTNQIMTINRLENTLWEKIIKELPGHNKLID